MMKKSLVGVILLSFLLFACGKKTEKQPVMSSQEKYVIDHPELSEDMKKMILDEVVAIGMNEEQVMASWGRPDDIQVFSSEYNSYKRWIFKNRPKVYWNDGKVSQLLK
jgi:hypothetical protein